MEIAYDDPRVQKIVNDSNLTLEQKNALLKPFDFALDDLEILDRLSNPTTTSPTQPTQPTQPTGPVAPPVPSAEGPTVEAVEAAKNKYKGIDGGNSITGNYSLSEDPMAWLLGGTKDGITTKGAIPTAWSFGKSAWDIYAANEKAKNVEKSRLATLANAQHAIDSKIIDSKNKKNRQYQLAGYGLTSGNSHANQALLYTMYRPEEYRKINLMQYA